MLKPYDVARSLLFQIDPERAHNLVKQYLRLQSQFLTSKKLLSLSNRNMGLSKSLLGLTFSNQLGLAAGFDEEAAVLPALQSLGFGFIEVGGVTAYGQPGNERPRIFRLLKDRALMNRLGFNNLGAQVAANNIRRWRHANKVHVPIGVNIGKTKEVALESAGADYVLSMKAIWDVADFIVINNSSPNTANLRELQHGDLLKRLLDPVMDFASRQHIKRPVLLKIAPDLTLVEALSCIDEARKRGVSGFVVSNTTVSREGLNGPVPKGPGGISGAPLFNKSTLLLKRIRGHVGPNVVLIGVGGIMSLEQAKAKIAAGADLIQIYTGFVYHGPSFVRNIIKSL